MKKKKRLIWQLYPSYLLITLISLAAVSWYASDTLRKFFIERKAADVEIRARLLTESVNRYLSPLDASGLDRLCKKIGKMASTRVTVILPDGKVAGDSEEDPMEMDNHGGRPEVIHAFRGKTGVSIRYSRTLELRMLYVAVPLDPVEDRRAVLRTSIPLTAIDNVVRSVQVKIAFGGLLIALLASGICLYVSGRISRPIRDMRQGAKQFAEGNLEHRLVAPKTRELAGLADAMNMMAAQLRERMKTVVEQRREIEAILSSMVEGVIAVDTGERIIKMNPAAESMFHVRANTATDRTIHEIIRNSTLYDLVKNTLALGSDTESDITVNNERESVLNTICSPLRDSGGKRIGALVVFQDVTKLRHLENVRRDFVANVSHEIKTPLTAIKGFVETLLRGAIEDPGEARQFLAIVDKHADRLAAIIEDLLQLSRLENESDMDRIKLENCAVKNVILAAVQVCEAKANEKEIRIRIECTAGLRAKMDTARMEQVFVNLLDNAVKYSGEKSEIHITAEKTEAGVAISFKDFGIGISKTHLPRLFERFYRVDKARSRKLGGTGLGLAIVKHIVRAHMGCVSVESSPGQGSVFKVRLSR